jgi:hypothetical protein
VKGGGGIDPIHTKKKREREREIERESFKKPIASLFVVPWRFYGGQTEICAAHLFRWAGGGRIMFPQASS